MKNKKNFYLIVLLLVTILMFSLVACNNNTVPVGPYDNGKDDNISKPDTNEPEPPISKPSYKTADNSRTGFKVVDKNELISTNSRVITKDVLVQNKNPWWFLLGNIGLVPYLLQTHTETVVADTYTTNTYLVKTVENANVWSSSPIKYTGGEASISIGEEDITTESITNSYYANLSFSLGVSYIGSAEVSATFGQEISNTYAKAKSVMYNVSFGINGYEPNMYYRISLVSDYNVYKVVTTNQKGEVVEDYMSIKYIDSTFYSRLEGSNTISF